MNKPSNKIRLIWATFILWAVCCLLSIILGRGETTTASVSLAFAGMTGWLFKTRYDEKKAGLMESVNAQPK